MAQLNSTNVYGSLAVTSDISEGGTQLSSKYAPISHTHSYAGSSSAGGAATSANKLNTNAGGTTTPVYFSGGVPVALSYTIAKSVPSDAKFTDTVYTHPSGFGAKTTSAVYKFTVNDNGHVTAGDQVTSMPASDVYAWAKASTKPTYTYSEVGAAASNHSHDHIKDNVDDKATYLEYGGTALTTTSYFAAWDTSGSNYYLKKITPANVLSTIGGAASGHTHTTSIATSSGTNQITLAASTKYALTAGGTSYVFTTPPDTNTWRPIGTGATDCAAGNHTHTTLVDSGNSSYTVSASYQKAQPDDPAYFAVWDGSEIRAYSKNSVCSQIGAATSSHTHATSIATSSGTNQITLAASTKYAITAGGTSYVFTTPPNTVYTHPSGFGAKTTSAVYKFTVNDNGHVTAGDQVTSMPASDVYSWAKAASKPSYTASEVGAQNLFRYGTTGGTTKIKIKINSAINWMLCFTVTLYQAYRATKIMISGYQYGSYYWYQPEATILGDSDGTETINVYFGYDSTNNLWVGFDGGNYTGVSISDVTNGYSQITNFDGLFTISDVSSLSTLQTTVTAQSKANYANTAGSATDSTKLPLAGGTMTGLLTTTTGSTHAGIKAGSTYINSIQGDLILQNNNALRFGTDSWDYDTWAGLKYVHSSKIVYLGLADGTAFTANSAQSGGKVYFPGISDLYTGNGSYKVWHQNNDGSGSGLDADLLDGNHASAFAASNHSHDHIKDNSDDHATYLEYGGTALTTASYFGAWDTSGSNYYLKKIAASDLRTAISAASSSHTHTTTIAASSGTNQLTMAANTKYSITAGGTSYIFTTPPNVDISGKADKASITAGTAGTSSATSGSSLSVPYVTMSAQGIVTGYGTHTHTVTGFAASNHSHDHVKDNSDDSATYFEYGGTAVTTASYFAAWATSGSNYYLKKISAANLATAIGASDTKNTAGAKKTSDTIYLTGVKSGDLDTDYGVTYTSTSRCWVTDGSLYCNYLYADDNIYIDGSSLSSRCSDIAWDECESYTKRVRQVSWSSTSAYSVPSMAAGDIYICYLSGSTKKLKMPSGGYYVGLEMLRYDEYCTGAGGTTFTFGTSYVLLMRVY